MLSQAKIQSEVIKLWLPIKELAKVLCKHDGVDYLYLLVGICGPLDGKGMVCNQRLEACVASGQERPSIAQALDQLDLPPRLVVLATPIAPPPDSHSCWPWLLHLSHEIVERGVLGVLTLQHRLEQDAWQQFLKPFFTALTEHGQMDQAALTARRDILDSSAPWAPVLISRLRNARLWYAPRFMDERSQNETWELLLSRIREDRCTPIIGPGIDYRIARFRQQIAQSWADRYQYPLDLHHQVNLPQVAQYIVATRGDAQMEQDFKKDVRKFALRRYGHLMDEEERQLPLGRMLSAIAAKVMLNEPNDPHIVLASLPFSNYVTANFNNFLADALRLSHREPQEVVFDPDFDSGEINESTKAHPLVYHLFGHIDDIQSLVLTEDHYFDFLIDFLRERERVPNAVRKALTGSSLLFLGFNLNNWDFRVLFRSLLKLEGKGRRWKEAHVAVQIDTSGGSSIPGRKSARRGRMDSRIFAGSPSALISRSARGSRTTVV